MKITALLLSFSLILIFSSCKKDEADPVQLEEIPPMSFMDSLSGTFVGYRYFYSEHIDCPTGYPPCTFTYTYDTVSLTVNVVNIGDTALQVNDMNNSLCNRIIQVDEYLSYSGPQVYGPSGYYNLNYSSHPFNSLTINLYGTGSSAFGALTNTYDYVLVRQ